MLEVNPSESIKHGKIHFRKTWNHYLFENAPWFLLLYVPALALVTVDIVYSIIGRQQMIFHFLVGFFLLYTLLILWGHRRTGNLQKILGRDVKTNKETVRALCVELGWSVILKKPSYDVANIPAHFLGLPYLRRAIVLYEKSDIWVSVISYNIVSQPGPDLFPFDKNLARSFGQRFLAKLN